MQPSSRASSLPSSSSSSPAPSSPSSSSPGTASSSSASRASFEAQEAELAPDGPRDQARRPTEREAPRPVVTSEAWAEQVASEHGARAEPEFFDGLRDDDDTVDISDVVAHVGPVLAAVSHVNTGFRADELLGRTLRREGARDPEAVMCTIVEADLDALLTIPKGFPTAASLQEQRRQARAEVVAKFKQAADERRARLVMTGLGRADDNDVPDVVRLAVHIVEAFEADNPALMFTHDATFERLGQAMAEHGANDARGIAAALVDLFPSASIPARVDPEGAEAQRAAREEAARSEAARSERRDEVEDARHAAHAALRTPSQAENAERLVAASTSLNGTLQWCPSGFERGPLDEADRAWYAAQEREPPREGRNDPRVHQPGEHGRPDVDNAFTAWIRSDPAYDPDYRGEPRPEPSVGSAMNCWEGVLFAAFKAGLVSKAALVARYRACKAAGDPQKALLAWLGYERACLFERGKREPGVGDILFYGEGEHVAIHKGGGRVLQLWHDGRPRESGLTLEAKPDHRESDWEELATLGHAIRFAPSPF